MNTERLTLEDLLLASDFGRADPARVRRLIDAALERMTGGVVTEEEGTEREVAEAA